jgi:hypothetical protein
MITLYITTLTSDSYEPASLFIYASMCRWLTNHTMLYMKLALIRPTRKKVHSRYTSKRTRYEDKSVLYYTIYIQRR